MTTCAAVVEAELGAAGGGGSFGGEAVFVVEGGLAGGEGEEGGGRNQLCLGLSGHGRGGGSDQYRVSGSLVPPWLTPFRPLDPSLMTVEADWVICVPDAATMPRNGPS